MDTWWLGVILGTMPISSASHRILLRSGKFWKMSKPSSVKWPVSHPLSSDPCTRESKSVIRKTKSHHTTDMTTNSKWFCLLKIRNIIWSDHIHWLPGKLSHVRQDWVKAPGGCVFLLLAAEPLGFCPCILYKGTAWAAVSVPDLLPHFHGDPLWIGTLARLQRCVSKAVVKCSLSIIRWLPPGVY